MQFHMKKEEKTLLDEPKPRSIYKYELKATNEILKDTLDICHSSLLNTATTNRHTYPPFDSLEQDFNHPHSAIAIATCSHQNFATSRLKRQQRSKDFSPSNRLQKTAFQEYQYGRKDFTKESKLKDKKEMLREWDYLDKDAFINSEIYSYSDDSQSSHEKRTEGLLGQNKSAKKIISSKKDLRRQRRGLADISLKVKNIVARLGKMTFKEVSDEVLKESQEDLPSEPNEKEKQTKNIRRRVYDALNVLVAVGILAKEQRCVVHTEFTSIRGKKLSEHYDIVAERNRSLKEHVQIYQKKLANLNLLQKNFKTLLLFHERNRNQPIEKREEHTRGYSVRQYCKGEAEKLYFPLIFLLPPKIMTQKVHSSQSKIRIQIEYQDRSSEYVRKYLIEGTDYILTDLDTLKYLDLTPHRQSPSNLGEQIAQFTPREEKNPDKPYQSKDSPQIYLSD